MGLPPDIETIRAGDYWRHGIGLSVACGCGRTTRLDSWVVVKAFGEEWRAGSGRLDRLRARLRCGRCGARPADIALAGRDGPDML